MLSSHSSIKMTAVTAHPIAGIQFSGLPEAQYINAGIPATNTRKPSRYPNEFFISVTF